MRLIVRGGGSVAGAPRVPGDKAIAHRALMLAAAARGESSIAGLPSGEDVAATASCVEAYGVEVLRSDGDATVRSPGIGAWREPAGGLDCRNSGTTMRILSGLAARREFRSVLDGDESLRKRPMDRVVQPLRALGARVDARDGRLPPLEVSGGSLTGAEVRLRVASGQVKSCVLLAGLGASGRTAVVEPHPSRDDTERMLRALGVDVRSARTEAGGVRVEVQAADVPSFSIDVPGDLSSAAYPVTAALLAGSVALSAVALNPTRAGFLEVVARMGARLEWKVDEERVGEPVGGITAERSSLAGVVVEGPIVPSLVDELPLVAVLATQAAGETAVSGAAELRVKESDRIAALSDGLGRLGASFRSRQDGFVVEGPTPLRGAVVESWGDHRIAMSLALAANVADGETTIEGWDAVAVTWPGFEDVLRGLGVDCEVDRR